jgi:hypothetical protein
VARNVDFPGSKETVLFSINNRGRIVGGYQDAGGTVQHFLLDKGVFTPIDYPGAAFTVPFDLNDRDQVVGSYLDAAGKPQGFQLDDGVYTMIDTSAFPSAQLLGLNDRGEIVGGYLDLDGKAHGPAAGRQGQLHHLLRTAGQLPDRGGWTSTIDARSSASSGEQRHPAARSARHRMTASIPQPDTQVPFLGFTHKVTRRRGLHLRLRLQQASLQL